MPRNSSALRPDPAEVRSLSRAASGVAVFRVASSVRQAVGSVPAVSAYFGDVGMTSSFDQVWNAARSVGGTPSSSQITVTGSGSAYRITRSAVPYRGSAASGRRRLPVRESAVPYVRHGGRQRGCLGVSGAGRGGDAGVHRHVAAHRAAGGAVRADEGYGR
jgi:hypothetical protein